MARSFLLREHALEQPTEVDRDAYGYATIIVKRPELLLVEQRLHTYRTNWTLLLLLQTVRPKRETIRV